MKQNKVEDLPEASGDASIAAGKDCAICLDPIVDPYVIPSCKHSFCFGCLTRWQASIKNSLYSKNKMSNKPKLSCPACRADTQDVEESILTRVRLYASRANNSFLNDVKQRELRDMALTELQKLEFSEESRPLGDIITLVDVLTEIQRLSTRADLLLSLKEPEKAKADIERMLEVHELANEKGGLYMDMRQEQESLVSQGRITEADELGQEIQKHQDERNTGFMPYLAVQYYTNLGEVEEMMEKWENANEIYFKMLSNMQDPSTMIPGQQCMIFMGLSRCAYHLGEYEEAIANGEIAIQINRHLPNVHKFVALSQKAMGDNDAARATMGRALVYETLLDEQHKADVLRMYHALKDGRSIHWDTSPGTHATGGAVAMSLSTGQIR
jgi:tetratricopeptide (TPR) repeat protein